MSDRWQDSVLKVLEFHEKQLETHGIPVPPNVKNGWSVRDTASHFSVSIATTSYDLRLAKAIREDPEKFENVSKTKAISLLDGDPIRIEVKDARCYLVGNYLGKVEIGSTMHYIVRLDKPIKSDAIDINLLVVPQYYCRILR